MTKIAIVDLTFHYAKQIVAFSPAPKHLKTVRAPVNHFVKLQKSFEHLKRSED